MCKEWMQPSARYLKTLYNCKMQAQMLFSMPPKMRCVCVAIVAHEFSWQNALRDVCHPNEAPTPFWMTSFTYYYRGKTAPRFRCHWKPWHMNLCFAILVRFEITSRITKILPQFQNAQVWMEPSCHDIGSSCFLTFFVTGTKVALAA